MSKTETILAEMIQHARQGHNVYPFMWQSPMGGISNYVSAAIRRAKKEGLLVVAGKDGMGKPFYRMPLPAATHEAPAYIQ